MALHPLPPPVSELEKRLRIPEGELDGEDLVAASAALEDVAALILSEVPPHVADAWALAAPASVQVIALKAARREYENPRGAIGESIGGHYLSLTQSNATGVYLTPSELETIHRAAGAAGAARGKRVGTIRIKASYE